MVHYSIVVKPCRPIGAGCGFGVLYWQDQAKYWAKVHDKEAAKKAASKKGKGGGEGEGEGEEEEAGSEEADAEVQRR